MNTNLLHDFMRQNSRTENPKKSILVSDASAWLNPEPEITNLESEINHLREDGFVVEAENLEKELFGNLID